MQMFRFKIKPLTAFGGAIQGDTLFGQLCWMIRHCEGEEKLKETLQGYTEGSPFAVVSDAFPAGYLPRPALSSEWLPALEKIEDRKQAKKKIWLINNAFHESLNCTAGLDISKAEDDSQIVSKIVLSSSFTAQKKSLSSSALMQLHAQPHNSINRQTGTTGEDGFAPYVSDQLWFYPGLYLELYVVLDEKCLTSEKVKYYLELIGKSGYGRDASIGLGKFELVDEPQRVESAQPEYSPTLRYLTLAACAPETNTWCATHSFYQPFTRFGRHGDALASKGSSFKKPVLMMKSGAMLTPKSAGVVLSQWAGQGIGNISDAQSEAVHQGYAPLIPFQFVKPSHFSNASTQ